MFRGVNYTLIEEPRTKSFPFIHSGQISMRWERTQCPNFNSFNGNFSKNFEVHVSESVFLVKN